MVNFIVRAALILVPLYLLSVIIAAFNGVSLKDYEYLLGHSFILDTLLLALCYAEDKFHCKFMRYSCYNLLFADILGLLQKKFYIFSDPYPMLYTLSVAWSLSAIITMFLAFRHFRKVQKIKARKNNGIK